MIDWALDMQRKLEFRTRDKLQIYQVSQRCQKVWRSLWHLQHKEMQKLLLDEPTPHTLICLIN